MGTMVGTQVSPGAEVPALPGARTRSPHSNPEKTGPPTSWSLTHGVRRPAQACRGRSHMAVSGRPSWPLPSRPGPPVQSRAPCQVQQGGRTVPPHPSAGLPQSPKSPRQQSGQTWPGKRWPLPQTPTLSHHLPGVLLCHRRGMSYTPLVGLCLQRACQETPRLALPPSRASCPGRGSGVPGPLLCRR